MRIAAHVAWFLLAFTTAAGLLVAAGPPLVALRVDLEPTENRGDATALEVVVQVAPEDRARLGASAWLELELRRGRETVERVSRAVEVDGHGRVRLEALWPAGSYELDVEIRSARGDARGLWSDRVTVPALGPAPEPTPPPEPTARPSPPPTPTPPPAVDPEPEAAPAPPLEPASTPAPEPDQVSSPTPAPRAASPDPTPSPAPTPEQVAAAEPAQVTATATVAPAAATEPTAAPAPTPELVATATAPPPRTEASPPGPAGDTVEVTVLVTRMQRPVAAVARETLSLKVDGDAVPVVALEGPKTAPLSLALAVDLSSTMAPHLPELGRLLGQLTLQVTAGGGSVSLVLGDDKARRPLDWGASPEAILEALRSAGPGPQGDLAGMVTAAFTGLVDRRGRRLVLVVTDGGDTGSRDDWRRADEAAAAAAAPILVVELPGLEGRPASALDRLVESCGGERFAAPTGELMGTVLRHYGDLLEAAYSVRFQRPEGARSAPLKPRITTADDTLEVRHPKQLR